MIGRLPFEVRVAACLPLAVVAGLAETALYSICPELKW
jgi:hypothetical protein